MSEEIRWSSYHFTLRSLGAHKKVEGVVADPAAQFLLRVQRSYGDTLQVLVTNEYVFSVAYAVEFLHQLPAVNIFCNAGYWNRTSFEAKKYCFERRVFVGQYGDVLGALNYRRYWDYGR